MSNTVDFKTSIDKKDLEVFAKALFEQVTKLQIENRELTEQVAHLEELLMNVPNVLNFEKDRND